jgi:hypothetical protein
MNVMIKIFTSHNFAGGQKNTKARTINVRPGVGGWLIYSAIGALFHWILIGSSFTASFLPGYIVIFLWPLILLIGLLGAALVIGAIVFSMAAILFGTERLWRRMRGTGETGRGNDS